MPSTLVIATAGHVDHGKSTLVRALTGMEPDRWAEERRRGLTIDLGYAWTTLRRAGAADDAAGADHFADDAAGDGVTFSFVDVPGHRRFVANMLAGVGPVPAALLVVAADGGWAPQTAEHVAALDALGVRHAVVAVTRSDLADPASVIADVAGRIADTTLRGIEIVAVSAARGTGMADLRAALLRLAARVDDRPKTATRLWIDRVFTMRGAGTVVTGTLGGGRLAVGDEVSLTGTSGWTTVGIRDLRSLDARVGSASAVARVAVNLRGVAAGDIERGDALVASGRWLDVTSVDARIARADARLPDTVTLHVGSAAVASRVRRLDARHVRLTWSRALPLHVGERVVLRDPGSAREDEMIVGAVLLDVDPPAVARRGAPRLRAHVLAGREPRDPRAELRARGACRATFLVAAGIVEPGTEVAGALTRGDWLIEPRQWETWRARLRRLVVARASEQPLTPGVPPALAARRLDLPDASLLAELVRASGGELVLDADGVHRPATVADLPAAARASLNALLAGLASRPFAAPESEQLRAAGLGARQLAVAVRRGELVRIADGVYLAGDAVARAGQVLDTLPADGFTLSEARQALGTTRRVAVPLLELLDARGMTRRLDERRRVRVPGTSPAPA